MENIIYGVYALLGIALIIGAFKGIDWLISLKYRTKDYCEICQKAVLPFHLGHSVFDAGCFMKKLGLSQVTWCYPLLSQTASFCKHLSASESLLCKFLKNKKMVSHLARVLCSSAFPCPDLIGVSHGPASRGRAQRGSLPL